MPSSDGRFWLLLNGEIYNYRELRSELRALGHRFRTESDSEVLLAAYQAWGAKALDRLIGMFAFIIWDDHQKYLFAARDRLGVKPLVFHTSNRGIAFGSEIKQLIGLPGFVRRINLDRAFNFLQSGVTDHSSDTMFAEASSLGPGRWLALDLKTWRPGNSLPIRQYWRLPPIDDSEISVQDAAERFRELFLDSVRMQMRADVRVGSCLSGGLDSSSIVAAQALLRPSTSEAVHAVSAVFPGTSVDESRFIDHVVAASGAVSERVTLNPEDIFAESEAIVRAQDEPYGSTSIHAQYHVFRRAREIGVKVMLDGQGADEILGGYHGCFHFHYVRLIRDLRLVELLGVLGQRKSWHGIGYRQQLLSLTGRLPGPFRRLLHPPGNPTTPAPQWLNGDYFEMRLGHPPENALVQALEQEDMPPIRSLGDYCSVLTRSISLPMLLRYEDRNSMAHGIEARVPFLDHRLVEFCLRLGHQHKIVGGDTKRVLREAMRGLLPEPVRNRRDKLGFATPEELWFKGPLREPVMRAIEETLELYPELFNLAATRQLSRQMLDGERPFDFLLWRIVVFGIWGRTFGLSL
jgi:asparagine synthase (glutamine-hydrolysing)